MQLQEIHLKFVISILLFGSVLTGCATLDDIETSRKFAPKYPNGISKSQLFDYDPDFRGYRIRPDKNHSQESSIKGPLVRDELGKKIQTGTELESYLKTRESPGFEKHKVAMGSASGIMIVEGIAEVIFLWPVMLVQGVLNLPMQPVISNVEAQYRNDAEIAYISGRENVISGKPDEALADLERAVVFWPALKEVSDVDYWKGRAFESLNQPEKALAAYEDFLNFSESSSPPFFKEKDSLKDSWKSKADDADARISQILKNVVSMESKKGSLKESNSSDN